MPYDPSLRAIRLSKSFAASYATVAAITFSATSSAPTPLYRIYQSTMGLQPVTVTLIFAVYAFAMMAAFLTVARLSDYVGRRPMVLTALMLNSLALVLFIVAPSAAVLLLARAVQGVATGIALTTLGATIVDTAPGQAATLNSITAFIGLAAGSLLAGILITFAPLPTRLVYGLLLIVTLGLVAVLVLVQETATGRPGAWRVLVPNVGIPAAAVGTMIQLLPLNLAAWALGGFYLSLMPSLVVVATGVKSPLIGAAVVSALMLTSTLSVLGFRRFTAAATIRLSSLFLSAGIAVTLIAINSQSTLTMFGGTIIAGIGFGATYAGVLRTLLPLAASSERAGLLAAYFIESYLSFAVPAIFAGLAAPHFGLVGTATVYGGLLAVLALAAFGLQIAPHRATGPQPS